jgi:hypothetical protein
MRTSLIVAALGLAACHSQPHTDANGRSTSGTQQSGAKLGSPVKMKPGRWQSTIEVVHVVADRMSAEDLAQLRDTEGRQVHTMCLTAKDLANPLADIFGIENAQCKYDHLTMTGGKIDGIMRCESPEAIQTITMTGKFDDRSYRLETVADIRGKQTLKLSMRVTGQYAGECTGEEDA